MNQIRQKLEEHPAIVDNPEKAMKETFVEVDASLRKDQSIDAELSGTTAVVCLFVLEASGKLVIHTANVGDSRATIGQKLPAGKQAKKYDLSEDQKPDTPAEADRIKKKGGFISPPEEEWGGPARVWLDANMTLPGLAMARSIGDHLVESVGVNAEPEVKFFELNPLPTDYTSDGEFFLVMASDGVWEFIESEDANFLVNKFINQTNLDATLAVTKLIETAAAKWRQEEGDYRDDITAIVVVLRGLFANTSAEAAAP